MNSVLASILWISILISLQALGQVDPSLPASADLIKLDSVNRRLSAQQLDQKNQALISEFTEANSTVVHKPTRLSNLEQEQAESVFQRLLRNSVTTWQREYYYDPDGSRGFCFGRAMFVHLELLSRGVDKASIRKVFAIGKLKFDRRSWDYHMATMVRGPNNTWWVIDSDPSVNRIMTLEEWYESQRNIAKNNRLGLYISEASKFDPYPGTYEASLRRGSFFRDLLEYFKLRVVSSDHRFKRSCNQVYR